MELEAEAGWDANAETQFGYGQSNPTYQLTDKDGKKYVLRKKPPGQLLSKVQYYKQSHVQQGQPDMS